MEEDVESRDWWTRYFESVEVATKKEKESNHLSPEPHDNREASSPLAADSGLLSPEGGSQLSAKDTKRMEKELERLEQEHNLSDSDKKSRSIRSTSATVRLVQRLSPKSQRKHINNESLLQ
ncbi:uncharacterized protein LOC111083718, partial [Limulus polyphemus]|uniref:Uncharacterized protein LOC111083718 n=1 Tax=Limulus polyphemus TaxID=6850 RepID=A0ABM1RXI4_LIMPO